MALTEFDDIPPPSPEPGPIAPPAFALPTDGAAGGDSPGELSLTLPRGSYAAPVSNGASGDEGFYEVKMKGGAGSSTPAGASAGLIPPTASSGFVPAIVGGSGGYSSPLPMRSAVLPAETPASNRQIVVIVIAALLWYFFLR